MKRLLKSLKFDKDRQPSQADQARIAQEIADLLQRAQRIGHVHASDDATESLAWGGKFTDMLASAWDIVTNFVSKIADWINGQEEIDEGDIEAEIETLAEHVGDFEIAAAIEQSVWETLYFAGVTMMVSVAQPDACQPCRARAESGPVPINDFVPPPYHGSCRCSGAPASEGE